MIEVAQETGVRLIAYSPLGLGILTGKYDIASQRLPQGPRRLLFKELLPAVQPILTTMGEIITERNRKKGGGGGGGRGGGGPVTYSQVALNWCRGKGAIPIVGLKSLLQAKEATAALDWSLSKGEMEALDQALAIATKGGKGQTVQNIFQTE